MNIENIQTQLYRAINHTLVIKKLIIAFIALIACGLTWIFFVTLAQQEQLWAAIGMYFAGFFACIAGILVSGVFFVRLYYNEVKERKKAYRAVLKQSLPEMGLAVCSVAPLLMAFIIMWLALGAFLLMGEIPVIGQFLIVVLAWGPFLLYTGMLVLGIFAVALLFLGAPVLALKTGNPYLITEETLKRVAAQPFYYLSMAFIALVPVFFMGCILSKAVCMTLALTVYEMNSLTFSIALMMAAIPACMLLAPFLVFFFNFATECFKQSNDSV